MAAKRKPFSVMGYMSEDATIAYAGYKPVKEVPDYGHIVRGGKKRRIIGYRRCRCGADFPVTSSVADRTRKYCDHSCANRFRNEP